MKLVRTAPGENFKDKTGHAQKWAKKMYKLFLILRFKFNFNIIKAVKICI